jgi:putative ABC transport system permease protein
MFKNFIKTMFRSLTKNRAYSFLNIFGLAVGIACAALIFLWIEDELNFDAVNTKRDNIYLVRENQKYDTYVFTHSSTPALLGPAIKQEIPGIANTCRSSDDAVTLLFAKGANSVFASGKYVEPSFFNMFSIDFVQGNAANAFNQLRSVVITQKSAKNFFGHVSDVVGKTIRVDNKQDYVVSGVIKDLPENTTVKFEWLMPFQIYFDERPWLNKWGNNSISTFVELDPGTDVTKVNKQLYNFVHEREPRSLGKLFLFGMKDWHLYDSFKDGVKTGGGQIEYVRLFTVIAWIILFIACINFMNLATARSQKRAREVGVRKVLGAGKNMLAVQFIGEAIFMSAVAAVLAVVIISFALPAFNLLVQKQLALGLTNPMHIAALLLLTLACGLIAGSYPSLYLSSFNPVAVLKGIKLKDSGAAYIRKGLVVLQFTASVVLIISTVIVYQQIQHVKSRNLGFNKDRLLEVDLQGDIGRNFEPIKQELLNSGNVQNVALSDHSIIYGGNNTSSLTWNGKPAGSQVLISTRYVDNDFLDAAGLKLQEGRGLTMADTNLKHLNVVITKKLADLMGKGTAVGKRLHGDGDTTSATVVGVVNDYVYSNMYGTPDPVIFIASGATHTTMMYVRIKGGKSIEATLSGMQGVLKKYNPAYPFSYRFVDDQFAQMFSSEMLVSRLSQVFAGLAIVISCLGLFGLAAYTAERRVKEIGIRKVLGASVSSVTGLLSKDFLKLVMVSCLVAFPIAYYLMQNWLKAYQYRIEIQLWVFAAAGAAAVIIAVLTISFQSIKAALANPVKSLRSE